MIPWCDVSYLLIMSIAAFTLSRSLLNVWIIITEASTGSSSNRWQWKQRNTTILSIITFSHIQMKSLCNKQAVNQAETTSSNIFRRTIKMASLMCTSLSLLAKVAPVSGQVKYTPDTERQAGAITGTLDLWKEMLFTNIMRQNANHCEKWIMLLVTFSNLDVTASPCKHTSSDSALSFSASDAASSSLLTISKSYNYITLLQPIVFTFK